MHKITDRPLEEKKKKKKKLSSFLFFWSPVTVVTKHEREAMKRRRQPRQESKKSWNPLRSQEKKLFVSEVSIKKMSARVFSSAAADL